MVFSKESHANKNKLLIFLIISKNKYFVDKIVNQFNKLKYTIIDHYLHFV